MNEDIKRCDYCGNVLDATNMHEEDFWPVGKYCNVKCVSLMVDAIDHQEYLEMEGLGD